MGVDSSQRQTTGDQPDHAWRRSSVALGDEFPNVGQECELLPVLKLQAPPKSKCKRQLISDSNTQLEVDRSDQFVPAVPGNGWKFPNSPPDRAQRLSTCDFLQPHEASSRFQHMSPSSFVSSSSFSSNFSSKKFKSPYGHIPPTSRTYEAVISPRNASSLQANFDKVCRCVSENNLADSRPTSCHCPLAKVHPDHFKDSQNIALQEQTEVTKSFGHLATSYLNKSSQRGSAQSQAGTDTHLRTKPSLHSQGLSETHLSDTQRPELTQKNQKQNEPDVFVFPDCVVKESARSQHERRRPNKREIDKVVPDCRINASTSSQRTPNRINKGGSDETDGLDSPMDTDDYSFQSNYKTLTSKYNMLSKFRPQDSLSPNVPWFTNDHGTLHSSINESCSLNYDSNVHSMTFTRDTHPAVFHDIHSEQDIVQNNRSTTARNRISSSEHHFPRTFYEHRTLEHQQELSARSSHSKTAEIVDTSELEDISQYLEEQESMLNEWTGQAPSSMRTSDSNNNRVPKNSLGRTELMQAGGDYPVNTSADTNVIYVSLNDVNSSTSSDDMDYEYEDNDTTTYRGHGSHVYDCGDEPDGKDRKLGWEHKTDQISGGQRCKSLVSHTRQQKLAKDHYLASDCHQPANYLQKKHPLGVSLPRKPQLFLANKESICHEKISFMVEDTYRTATRTADHVRSPQSPDSDSRILTAHSIHENQQKHHYHPGLNKNMKPLFHQLSTKEIPLSDTVERKCETSVTCQHLQTLHYHAHNNNDDFIINSNRFADEVDGLGDKNKNQTQKIDSQTGSHREDTQGKLIHCFDRNDPGSETHTVSQSTASTVANLSDDTNTPLGISSTRISLQEKHQTSPAVDTVTLSTQQTVDHLKKNPESCGSSQKQTNTETNTQERFVQGCNQHPDMYREMQGNVSYKKQSDTSMEHAAVCQSPDVRLRRRKSDTWVGEVTESSLSRSQSSPSKLGLTEDISTNRKPVFFHRPWLDQNIDKQQTLIPTVTQSPLICSPYLNPTSASYMSGSCTSPAVASASHDSTGSFRRMTVPTNTEYPCASSKQPISSDHRKDESPWNKGSQFGDRSTGNTRNCEDNLLNPVKELPAGPSAGPSRLLQPHHKRATEGRHKRKLEFSVHDSRNKQPPAQRQARQIHPCLPLHNLPESAGTDKEHLSQEQNTNSGQSHEKTANWQEEVNSSTNLSRQQGEESRPLPRNDDEVDIRVQITDVFQESTRLLQRLEGIYQADDRSCACSRIEQNILRTALDMFRALGNEASCREYWMHQLHQTNDVIKKTLDLAENFRRLCRHGRQITDVFPGSIFIRIKCRTVLSLVDLCELHTTGDLHVILYNILSQSVVFDTPGLTLTVTLDKSNVMTCQGYLLTKIDQPLKTRSGTRRRTENKMRPMRGVRSTENLYSASDAGSPCSHAALELCRSPLSGVSPHAQPGSFGSHRERKFSFGEINRTAFQELNISDILSPTSPSYGRLMRDDTGQISGKPDLILASSSRLNSSNVLQSPKLLTSPGSSPLTSPRKLSIRDIISEQENIDHNND